MNIDAAVYGNGNIIVAEDILNKFGIFMYLSEDKRAISPVVSGGLQSDYFPGDIFQLQIPIVGNQGGYISYIGYGFICTEFPPEMLQIRLLRAPLLSTKSFNAIQR